MRIALRHRCAGLRVFQSRVRRPHRVVIVGDSVAAGAFPLGALVICARRRRIPPKCKRRNIQLERMFGWIRTIKACPFHFTVKARERVRIRVLYAARLIAKHECLSLDEWKECDASCVQSRGVRAILDPDFECVAKIVRDFGDCPRERIKLGPGRAVSRISEITFAKVKHPQRVLRRAAFICLDAQKIVGRAE